MYFDCFLCVALCVSFFFFFLFLFFFFFLRLYVEPKEDGELGRGVLGREMGRSCDDLRDGANVGIHEGKLPRNARTLSAW